MILKSNLGSIEIVPDKRLTTDQQEIMNTTPSSKIRNDNHATIELKTDPTLTTHDTLNLGYVNNKLLQIHSTLVTAQTSQAITQTDQIVKGMTIFAALSGGKTIQ